MYVAMGYKGMRIWYGCLVTLVARVGKGRKEWHWLEVFRLVAVCVGCGLCMYSVRHGIIVVVSIVCKEGRSRVAFQGFGWLD